MLDEVESNGVDYAHNLPLSEKRVSLRRNTGDDELTWEQLDNNFEVLRSKLNEVLGILNKSPLVDSSFRAGKQSQTIAFEDIPVKTTTSGKFTLNVTASSGLPVTITSLNEAIATVDGNVVTIVGIGEVAFEARQDGDDTYYPAQTAREILKVAGVANAISFTSPGTLPLWQGSYVLNATATSGLPITYESSNDGVAVLNDGVLELVGEGVVTVTAYQGGDSVHAAADPVSVTFTVEIVSNDAIFDDYAILNQGNSGISKLGDESFTTSGNAMSPSGKLYFDTPIGSGIPATFILYIDEAKTQGFMLTTTGTPLGKIRFLRDNNNNYEIDLSQVIQGEPAVMTQIESVPLFKDDQTIDWDVISGTLTTGSVIELDATVSSGLSISYEYDDSKLLVDGTTLTLNQPGTVEIKLTQAGNGVYNPVELLVTLTIEDIFTSTITVKKVDPDGNVLSTQEITEVEGESVDLTPLSEPPILDLGKVTHRFNRWQSTTDPIYSVFSSPMNPSLTVVVPSNDVEYVILCNPVSYRNVKIVSVLTPELVDNLDQQAVDEFNIEVDLGDIETYRPFDLVAPTYHGYTFSSWELTSGDSDFSWGGADTDATRSTTIGEFIDIVVTAKYVATDASRVVGYLEDYDGTHFFTIDPQIQVDKTFTGTATDEDGVETNISGNIDTTWARSYPSGEQVVYTNQQLLENKAIVGQWDNSFRTGNFFILIPFDWDMDAGYNL